MFSYILKGLKNRKWNGERKDFFLLNGKENKTDRLTDHGLVEKVKMKFMTVVHIILLKIEICNVLICLSIINQNYIKYRFISYF